MIPEGWQKMHIADLIASIESGYSVLGEERQAEEGEIAILTLGSVSEGYFRPQRHKVVSGKERGNLTVSPKRDRVLVSRSNTPELVGAAAYIQEDYPSLFLPDLIWQLEPRPDQQFSMAWLCYLLQSNYGRARIRSIAVGSSASMVKIGKATFLSLEIPVPPLAEQRKIAAILGAWDEAIAAAERLVEALRKRKRGLMQRLLTGQVRFPEFKGLPWQERELRECVEPVARTAKVQPGQHYNLIGVRWYLEGAHIHDTVSGDEVVTQALSRIHENDIVYNKMWVTKAAFAVAKAEHHGAYGTSEYPTFTARDNLDVRYLEYAFHDPRFLHEAQALCRGTTGRARLNPEDFLKLKLRLPSRDEQARIAHVLDTVQQEIDHTQRYLTVLKEQKRGLMQRLLTGQVRVQVDEEQAA